VPSPRYDRRTAGNSRVARAAHNSIGIFNRFLAYYWPIRQLVRNQSDGRELTMGRWSMPTNMKVPVVTAPVRVRDKKANTMVSADTIHELQFTFRSSAARAGLTPREAPRARLCLHPGVLARITTVWSGRVVV
jgi:hypothetical protein